MSNSLRQVHERAKSVVRRIRLDHLDYGDPKKRPALSLRQEKKNAELMISMVEVWMIRRHRSLAATARYVAASRPTAFARRTT
jgi:hypothetical protein